MSRQFSILTVVCVVVPGIAAGGRGQERGTATAPAANDGALERARHHLAAVEDNVFSFDDEAFYWLCRHARRHGAPEAFRIGETEPSVPWKFLLERPSDYRGQLVVIEGVLQARQGFQVAGVGREDIGRIYQCELSEVGTRSLCAVITIEDPVDVPIRSRVRVKGFFLKVRGYRTTAGDLGAGPLLVARRLETVRSPALEPAGPGVGGGGVQRWMLGATAVLAMGWLALRRRLRRPIPTGPGRGPLNVASAPTDDDFAWLTEHGQDEAVTGHLPDTPWEEGGGD